MKLPFVSRELYERVLAENSELKAKCERLEIAKDELTADLLTAQSMTKPEEDDSVASSRPRRLHTFEIRERASQWAKQQNELNSRGKIS